MNKRRSPKQHIVKTHRRKGKLVRAYLRGKRQKEIESIKTQLKIINWDIPTKLRKDEKLVWMSPEEFLGYTPHPQLPGYPSTIDPEGKYFSKSSLDYLTDQIRKGEKIDCLMLDFTKKIGTFPSHEGRHRALIAKRMGFKKVPVLVIE